MQATDRVDIATVFAADEDFELRIDGASISDEGADHLLDCRVDGDERMTLEEFLVDVERQEAVGVVAGNGECRLGEVVGTEGSEAIDGVNVIVMQFVWVFLGAVLFRLPAQYARRSALCPAGICAFTPSYVLGRCADILLLFIKSSICY